MEEDNYDANVAKQKRTRLSPAELQETRYGNIVERNRAFARRVAVRWAKAVGFAVATGAGVATILTRWKIGG